MALVEYCAYAEGGSVVLHVIEGNNPDSVQRSAYPLDNSQILGFGCWDDVVDTTMQYGNTGDKVLKLQQDLGRLGYLSARNYTSTYASNTRNAVYHVPAERCRAKRPRASRTGKRSSRSGTRSKSWR